MNGSELRTKRGVHINSFNRKFSSICETIMNLLFRQKEAEALRERMEREKRELQEFIGNMI